MQLNVGRRVEPVPWAHARMNRMTEALHHRKLRPYSVNRRWSITCRQTMNCFSFLQLVLLLTRSKQSDCLACRHLISSGLMNDADSTRVCVRRLGPVCVCLRVDLFLGAHLSFYSPPPPPPPPTMICLPLPFSVFVCPCNVCSFLRLVPVCRS